MNPATSTEPATPAFSIKDLHDRAREFFAVPEHMADLLHQRLPAEVCEALALDSLRLLKESFVDEESKEAFSDLVFSCTTREGVTAYVYALFEREEQPAPLCALKAMLNMTELWRKMPKISGPQGEEENLRDFFEQEAPLPDSLMDCVPSLLLTTFSLENLIKELPEGELQG
ncbi:hypothetical protein B5F76_03150 [Desulfovibrio sp. An276]|nr:hypothetical protein B5F76_03150 [Desulfovibrio sp. An276]